MHLLNPGGGSLFHLPGLLTVWRRPGARKDPCPAAATETGWAMTHRLAPVASVLAVLAFLVWLGRSSDDVGRAPDPRVEDRRAMAVRPCAVPVAWRLADIDPRFGVSRDWVAGAARDAERIWGSFGGVPLLVEENDGGLGIRLVYDERQALMAGESPIRLEAAVYREATSDAEAAAQPQFREIRVFAFRDRVDLVRILAHELGHALGLTHAPAPGAVMSAEQDRADLAPRPLELQPPDRRALDALCSTSVAAPATR